MLRRLALVTVFAAALIPLSACSGPAPTPPAGATSESGAPAPAPAVAIRPMTIEERQQSIAPNFQVEVPVPFGEVVRGQAQGDLAWDYELIVAAPPADVARWYSETYLGRDWSLVGQTAPSPGAITLTMTKNAAETRVSITPEGGGGSSRVKAVLGVGAPVLQTQ